MAHVTDYDVWHVSEETVTAEMVFRQFHANVRLAQQAVVNAIELLSKRAAPCSCHSALQGAFATAAEKTSAAALDTLRPIVGKYFNK